MVVVVIPTRNGGGVFQDCLRAIATQNLTPSKIIVLDSSSSDETLDFARAAGCEIHPVAAGTFNHGGTRSAGLAHVKDEIVVFLTQDAILADAGALDSLVRAFDDPQVGAAYGRQLPHHNANPLAKHARLRNYPDRGYVVGLDGKEPRGLRKTFNSNSFAAYRRAALEAVGQFPSNVILGEDVVVAARMLVDGWKVAYVHDACAFHSHNYSIIEEARRSFDIGVFHRQEDWIISRFGRAEGEGVAFVIDQLRWLRQHASFTWLVRSIATNAARYGFYRLGTMYDRLPSRLVLRLTMNKPYFAKS